MNRRLHMTAAGGILAGILAIWGCVRPEQGRQQATSEPIEGLENPSVHILTDRQTAPPRTGTFGWGLCLFRVEPDPEISLSDADARLRKALAEGFAEEGLTYVEDEPDYLVSYALASGAALDDGELNRAYGDLLEPPERDRETALHYNRGVLVVDVVNRREKHLLWRGAIMADIDMSLPEQRKQARADGAVRALLHYYPTPPATR